MTHQTVLTLLVIGLGVVSVALGALGLLCALVIAYSDDELFRFVCMFTLSGVVVVEIMSILAFILWVRIRKVLS